MDITSMLVDSEMGSAPFTVERIVYSRSTEGTVSHSTSTQACGCIHPGTVEMLKLLPEEERHETYIVIYTDYPLSTGTSEDTDTSFIGADRIHWNGQVWRVVNVRDWQGFGYCRAIAVLVQE